MMAEPLFYEGRAMATPGFRIMLWLDTSVSDQDGLAQGVRLLDAFLADYAAQVSLLMQGGRRKSGKPTHATPQTIAKAREWLATPPHKFPTTLRLTNYAADPLHIATAPYFRIEEGRGMIMVEFMLAQDDPNIVPFADRITALAADMPVICGVMGMGFLLPENLSSLYGRLPVATPRYRTAIQFNLTGPVAGIRRHRSHFNYAAHPGVDEGIADIGWRTLIGTPFMARLPDLAPLEGDPRIDIQRKGNMVAITAGPAPIWGDVNRAEDISAYALVARALRGIRMHEKVARQTLFMGCDGNPDLTDRVTAYLHRFEAPQ